MYQTIYKSLIGKNAIVENRSLQIIEVLLDEEIVVLEQTGSHDGLQQNQFGDIHRRSRLTHNVALRSEVDKGKLHPVLVGFVSEGDKVLIEEILRKTV